MGPGSTTFATQWIRHGGDIKALQSILGHKDAMVTLNVYADIEPMSKIQNMLRVSPSLWRGYLGLRVGRPWNVISSSLVPMRPLVSENVLNALRM